MSLFSSKRHSRPPKQCPATTSPPESVPLRRRCIRGQPNTSNLSQEKSQQGRHHDPVREDLSTFAHESRAPPGGFLVRRPTTSSLTFCQGAARPDFPTPPFLGQPTGESGAHHAAPVSCGRRSVGLSGRLRMFFRVVSNALPCMPVLSELEHQTFTPRRRGSIINLSPLPSRLPPVVSASHPEDRRRGVEAEVYYPGHELEQANSTSADSEDSTATVTPTCHNPPILPPGDLVNLSVGSTLRDSPEQCPVDSPPFTTISQKTPLSPLQTEVPRINPRPARTSTMVSTPDSEPSVQGMDSQFTHGYDDVDYNYPREGPNRDNGGYYNGPPSGKWMSKTSLSTTSRSSTLNTIDTLEDGRTPTRSSAMRRGSVGYHGKSRPGTPRLGTIRDDF